jgi:hypothetical protein
MIHDGVWNGTKVWGWYVNFAGAIRGLWWDYSSIIFSLNIDKDGGAKTERRSEASARKWASSRRRSSMILCV